MSLLQVKGLVKRFGGLVATDHLDLDVRPGELHAIIGPNGAGKTTLLNQLAGELMPSAGSILLDDLDVTFMPVHERARRGISRSYQITSVFTEFSALQNVMFAVQAGDGHSFSFWRPAARDARLRDPAMHALEEVGLASKADVPVAHLAHGARRQLEIAMTLATRPRLLLLDEPMAGMSPQESREVTELLQRLKGRYGIVLVEHDMDAIFALADRISVLVYGKPIACGTPQAIRASEEVRRAYLGDMEEVL